MLLFSDLHLREESEEIVFQEVLPGIRAMAKARSLPVACLGDVLHFRYRVVVRILNRLRDTFREWGDDGIELTILPGNHDQIDVDGRNALEYLDDLPNVTVYTEPTWDQHGLWMPYRKGNFTIRGAKRLVPKEESPNVLFIHNAVQGAMMNDHVVNKDGIKISKLRRFDHVIAGHYHKRQSLDDGRVIYVGSPYQTRADEAGQTKGCGLWIGEPRRFGYVNADWGPKYHKLEVTEATGDLGPFKEGDRVQVKAAPGVDIETLAKRLDAAGVRHTITPEVVVSEQRLDVDHGAGLREYALAYVDSVEMTQDRRDDLMRIYDELREAL